MQDPENANENRKNDGNVSNAEALRKGFQKGKDPGGCRASRLRRNRPPAAGGEYQLLAFACTR